MNGCSVVIGYIGRSYTLLTHSPHTFAIQKISNYWIRILYTRCHTAMQWGGTILYILLIWYCASWRHFFKVKSVVCIVQCIEILLKSCLRQAIFKVPHSRGSPCIDEPQEPNKFFYFNTISNKWSIERQTWGNTGYLKNDSFQRIAISKLTNMLLWTIFLDGRLLLMYMWRW